MKLIVGGGISGLSTAYYLSKKVPSSDLILVEATNRLGGWIKSTNSENGHIFELGPRTIRPRGNPGANTLELIEDLNLESKIIPIKSSHPAAKNRMIYVNGQLHYLPSSLLKVFLKTKPFSQPLIFSALRYLYAPIKKIPENDEPIYDFVERRFGKDIAEYAISPLICGICAGDAKEISVKFLMQSLFELEQKHNGIIEGIIKNYMAQKSQVKESSCKLVKRAKKEKWSVYSLENGLETLPLALSKHLKDTGVQITLNSPCTSLEFHHNKVFGKFKDTSFVADHVFSTLLAKQTGKLVEKQHPELASLLYTIPTVTVCVVNLQYPKVKQDLNAFGFLVPPSQRIPILGIIFDSCCFPNGNNTVLTVMMGGKWFQKYFGNNLSENILRSTALKYVKDILKIEENPESTSVNILKDCIPQYVVGHYDRVQKIYNYIQHHKLPISLCGSSYSGVGVNDVILSAKNAVNTCIKK